MFTLLKLFFVFILAAILVGLFIILAFVGNIWALFNKNKRTRTSTSNTYTTNNSSSQSDANYQSNGTGQRKKKIIPQDEGEYVDFEEVQ